MPVWLPSVSEPILPPRASLSNFAADLAIRDAPLAVVTPAALTDWSQVLWSVAEKALGLPRVERPGEKGGHGIYVERTLTDAFLPVNAALSTTLAFVSASAIELTRSGKINDLAAWLAGEEAGGEDEDGEPLSTPWEWDRVGHDTVANFTKDAGSQTLTRLIERAAKPRVRGATYCELLKHAHKGACKEFHDTRLAVTSRYSASASALKALVSSPGERAAQCPARQSERRAVSLPPHKRMAHTPEASPPPPHPTRSRPPHRPAPVPQSSTPCAPSRAGSPTSSSTASRTCAAS